jgi:hypothetical protein
VKRNIYVEICAGFEELRALRDGEQVNLKYKLEQAASNGEQVERERGVRWAEGEGKIHAEEWLTRQARRGVWEALLTPDMVSLFGCSDVFRDAALTHLAKWLDSEGVKVEDQGHGMYKVAWR